MVDGIALSTQIRVEKPRRLKYSKLLLLLLVFTIVGCAPVLAYDCAVYADRHGAPHLRATLSNKTDAVVTNVGVFVYTDASFADYEFAGLLGPHDTLRNRSGVEYAPGANGGNHFSRIVSCYARSATYANGKIWIVSPL